MESASGLVDERLVWKTLPRKKAKICPTFPFNLTGSGKNSPNRVRDGIKQSIRFFCAQSDLKQCVYLFRSQFERCGESEAADANRLAQAQRIYDALGTSNGTNGIDGNGQDLKKATEKAKRRVYCRQYN